MKAGIRSVGWWVPPQRMQPQDIAQAHGAHAAAVEKLGLRSKPLPGPADHPSTMAARATRHALAAAALDIGAIDLLIFTGVTRDRPAPWVAAHGVLHELGATGAAGFDLVNRCAAVIDGLWVAKTLVESGTCNTVVVCCADRFDHLLGAQGGGARSPADMLYSAGAAAAVVQASCGNTIAAYSHYANPNTVLHDAVGPLAGGTRAPLDAQALLDGEHLWSVRLSAQDMAAIAQYELDADRHNYARLMQQAGVDGFDLIACSPFDPAPQLASLEALGLDPARTFFTIPHLGHTGPSDLLLILGVALLDGRVRGPRIAMSMRTTCHANALAVVGHGSDAGIAAAGSGVDPRTWQ